MLTKNLSSKASRKYQRYAIYATLDEGRFSSGLRSKECDRVDGVDMMVLVQLTMFLDIILCLETPLSHVDGEKMDIRLVSG